MPAFLGLHQQEKQCQHFWAYIHKEKQCQHFWAYIHKETVRLPTKLNRDKATVTLPHNMNVELQPTKQDPPYYFGAYTPT